MKLGIIDVGTNSIHLLIGELNRQGRWRLVVHQQELARIGQGGLRSRHLTLKAMQRALAVLRRHVAALKQQGADQVIAVATSAIREAANGRRFVQRVRRQLALPLRIISGTEEARLIYEGLQWLHRFRGPTLMIAIGGGSAQVMLGSGQRLQYAISRPLGSARMAEQFIHHDPPGAEEVAALERAVRRAWAPVVRSVQRHRWRQVIGSSATIAQVLTAARMFGASRRRITQGALRLLVRRLSTSTAAQRRRLPGVEPQREALALPTAVILLTWMEGCGVTSIRHATGSLREGLVVAYLERGGRRELTARRRKRIMRRRG